MLKTKFARHTTAFLLVSLASGLVFPAIRSGLTVVTWILLGTALLGAILTLMTQ